MGQTAIFITPDELAKRWNGAVTKGTLTNWRHQGKGPPWRKLGSRVVYRMEDVLAWEESNTKPANDNTADSGSDK